MIKFITLSQNLNGHSYILNMYYLKLKLELLLSTYSQNLRFCLLTPAVLKGCVSLLRLLRYCLLTADLLTQSNAESLTFQDNKNFDNKLESNREFVKVTWLFSISEVRKYFLNKTWPYSFLNSNSSPSVAVILNLFFFIGVQTIQWLTFSKYRTTVKG